MSSWVLSLLVPCLVTCVWLCLVLVPPLLLLLKQDFKKKKAREPFACLPECSEWERDRCRAWPAGRLWAALRLWTGHWESFFFFTPERKKKLVSSASGHLHSDRLEMYLKKNIISCSQVLYPAGKIEVTRCKSRGWWAKAIRGTIFLIFFNVFIIPIEYQFW